MNTVIRIVVLSLAALAANGTPARAATMLSVDLGPGTGLAVGTSSNQYVGVSWTQTGTWTDVVIGAPLWTSSAAHTTGTAWITQATGPGAMPGDELASAAITFPIAQSATWTLLFSGLTLGPGTWNVVISVPYSASDLGYRAWHNGASSTVTGAGVNYLDTLNTLGAAADTTYAPASNFFTNYLNLGILVIGNGPSFPLEPGGDTPQSPAVPEPGTLALFAVGLLRLAARLRTALDTEGR